MVFMPSHTALHCDPTRSARSPTKHEEPYKERSLDGRRSGTNVVVSHGARHGEGRDMEQEKCDCTGPEGGIAYRSRGNLHNGLMAQTLDCFSFSSLCRNSVDLS
jgi:hypothetical protein